MDDSNTNITEQNINFNVESFTEERLKHLGAKMGIESGASKQDVIANYFLYFLQKNTYFI